MQTGAGAGLAEAAWFFGGRVYSGGCSSVGLRADSRGGSTAERGGKVLAVP